MGDRRGRGRMRLKATQQLPEQKLKEPARWQVQQSPQVRLLRPPDQTWRMRHPPGFTRLDIVASFVSRTTLHRLGDLHHRQDDLCTFRTHLLRSTSNLLAQTSIHGMMQGLEPEQRSSSVVVARAIDAVVEPSTWQSPWIGGHKECY